MISPRDAPVWVVDSIKDYEQAGLSPALLVYIDEGLYLREVKNLTWGWGDGPAQSLTGDIAGRLESDLQGAQVRVVSDIGGWTNEMFVSQKMRFTHPEGDWRTDLQAATAGGYAAEWKLGQDVELNTWPPQAVARYAAARLPYDQSDVWIHPFDNPKLVRTKPDALSPEDLSFDETSVIQSMFDVVEQEVLCIYYDTARGLRFETDPGFGGLSSIDWEFRRGSREIISWPAPQELTPDEQYAYVEVLEKYPSGNDRIRIRWPVNQRGRRFPAREGQVKYLAWSDTSVNSVFNAGLYAKLEAERAGKGIHTGNASVVFNPFMFPGRVVQFEEPYRDNAGTWQRVWLCVVQENVKHKDTGGALSTEFTYESTKQFEELVDVPALALNSFDSSFLASQAVRVEPRYYPWVGWDGEWWVDPEKAGWMGRDEEGFYFALGDIDEGGAGAYAGLDESGFFIVANVPFRNWGQTDVTFKQLNTPYSELA